MDLNYLYHRRGVSLLRAQGAASAPAREAHCGLYRAYGLRIAEARA